MNDRAPSPSSHAPPSLPLSEAAARAAAHCARTPAIHSSISAELPSSSIRSASEMWTQGLDRLSGPLRQQPGSDQPPHALIVKMHRDFHHISAASNYRPLSTLIADGLSDNTSPSTVVRLELRP